MVRVGKCDPTVSCPALKATTLRDLKWGPEETHTQGGRQSICPVSRGDSRSNVPTTSLVGVGSVQQHADKHVLMLVDSPIPHTTCGVILRVLKSGNPMLSAEDGLNGSGALGSESSRSGSILVLQCCSLPLHTINRLVPPSTATSCTTLTTICLLQIHVCIG